MIAVRYGGPGDRALIRDLLAESWGEPRVVAHGTVYDANEVPSLVANEDGAMVGLLTYAVAGDGFQIVTLDALTRRSGIGTALIDAAVAEAGAAGRARVWATTTNDNLDALRFYQRRGFRLARLRPGAVEDSRRIKPAIPLVGAYGILIRDEIDVERAL